MSPQEGPKKKLTIGHVGIALLLILVGLIALITPFTPGSWLALVGIGMLLGKSPKETLAYLRGLLKKVKGWGRKK